jgi:hypothetical protein
MAKKLPSIDRPYLLVGVLFLFGLAVSLWFFGGRASLRQTSFYPKLYPQSLPLSGNARITQLFRSKYPGLYQIKVYFARRGEDETGQIIFRVKESCSAADDLATLMAPVADITAEELYPFTFSPVADSEGRDFCFVLEGQHLSPSAGIGVYVSAGEAYGAGAATYQPDTTGKTVQSAPEVTPPTPRSGATYYVWLPLVFRSPAVLDDISVDVGFQLAYNAPVYAMAWALVTNIARDKPGLFGWPMFYVVLLVGYVLLLGWLCLVIFSSRFDSKL